MPAPGEDVEFELRRVGQLHQEDLVGRDRADRTGRKLRRQRVKAVEDDADRLVIGAPHDLPGVAMVADVASPGERLIADAQAAPRSELAQFAKISGGAIDATERNRRHAAADQEQVGLQLLHQVELALGSGETARPLRLGHALEIAKRLERADRKPEIAAALPDLAGTGAKRQQVVLEDLDRVEPGSGNGAELLVKRAAERDGGNRTLVHAACSMIWPGETRVPVRAASLDGFHDGKGAHGILDRNQRRLAAGDDGEEMPELLGQRIERSSGHFGARQRRVPSALAGIGPQLHGGYGQRALGPGEKVAGLVLSGIGRILARRQLPAPGCRRCVRHGHGADRAVCESQQQRRGVLDGKAAGLVRGQRLHLGDLAADEAEIVDVVNEVDQDRAAAALAPPGDVEIIVGLSQEPQADHGGQLSDQAAGNLLAHGLDDRIVAAMMADQHGDTGALHRAAQASRRDHRVGHRLLDQRRNAALDTVQRHRHMQRVG